MKFEKLLAVTSGCFNQEALGIAKEYNEHRFTDNLKNEFQFPPIEFIDGNE
ncbi:hypothetical protein ACFL3W_02545 [Pseudomonadota bacterium]